ncbi:MAG: hypothetical protein R3264_05750 [Anaerolineae bacterium]|nr:hypothetical protein [Anaerolineae bacterium]
MKINPLFSVTVQRLFAIFFGDNPNRGETSPALRRTIESFAADLSRTGQAPATIPPELDPYLRKVTLHAHKVTDEDIAALKAAGYSEEALFEITISAALGAGRTRLECGLAALKEKESTYAT